MTDAAIIAVSAGFLATVQAVSTAWLNRTINQNACGSPKCLQMLRAERTPGEVAVSGIDRARASPRQTQ